VRRKKKKVGLVLVLCSPFLSAWEGIPSEVRKKKKRACIKVRTLASVRKKKGRRETKLSFSQTVSKKRPLGSVSEV